MKIDRYQIELHDMHFYAHHGVMPQERVVGANFTVNIVLGVNDCCCADSDSIENTVSYADVYNIIKREMVQPSNLLENVCKRVMVALFDSFGTVEEIEITISKDTPPMGGDRLSAAVTMQARR